MPVQKATITLTVYGEAATAEEFKAALVNMELEDIARRTGEEDWFSETEIGNAETVPANEIRGFFDIFDSEDATLADKPSAE